jgi:transcriptional regulator with XRE-family HTH domain
MKITSALTDEAVLKLLGERVAAHRLTLNLTQQQVAEQAGLGLRTVQRLEWGASATQLSGFVRVCRVLGLAENLELLVPPPTPSPIAELKQARVKRQRASGRTSPPKRGKKWTWGETP